MFVCFCILVTGECPFDADVKCNGTGRCLRSHNICNRIFSCTYGGDEENCGTNITHIYLQSDLKKLSLFAHFVFQEMPF